MPDSFARFFSQGVLIGLTIGSLLSCFIFSRKHLIKFTIENNLIKLTYLNQLAYEGQITIPMDSLSRIKIKKKILLLRDFSIIMFIKKADDQSFYIANNGLSQQILKLTEQFSNKIILAEH